MELLYKMKKGSLFSLLKNKINNKKNRGYQRLWKALWNRENGETCQR